MRVLAITKIFPNAAEPLSAPFNRQQFSALREAVRARGARHDPVVPRRRAGVEMVERRQARARAERETIAGIEVSHPRTLFVPRLAHVAWGPMYAASIAPALRAYRGGVDVVLGSWAYPDGFAAVIAGQLLGVPSVVKLHGCDINVIAKLPGRAG